MADEQVLGFAHNGGHSAKSGPHGTVHHQIAQEPAELAQVETVLVDDAFILAQGAGTACAMGMVDFVESVGHGDDHRCHGQSIEEGGKKGPCETEEQGKPYLGFYLDQDFGKRVLEQILHEIDPGDHEHEQHDHRKIVKRFLVYRLGRGHAEHHGFDGQKTARGQGIAFQGHGQGEDEFSDEDPAGDEWSDCMQKNRIGDQKADDGQLVPVRRISQKIFVQCLGNCFGHEGLHVGFVMRKKAIVSCGPEPDGSDPRYKRCLWNQSSRWLMSMVGYMPRRGPSA